MPKLDRNILVFVRDRNGNLVPGSNLRFHVDGKLISTVDDSTGRASLQVHGREPEVRVDVEYREHSDSVSLAPDQDEYTFQLDLVVVSDVWDKYFPAGVGAACLVADGILLFSVDDPTRIQRQFLLVLLCLGAGGIASAIPGFLNVKLTLGTKALIWGGGALAVFLLVFFFEPAGLDLTDSP